MENLKKLQIANLIKKTSKLSDHEDLVFILTYKNIFKYIRESLKVCKIILLLLKNQRFSFKNRVLYLSILI